MKKLSLFVVLSSFACFLVTPIAFAHGLRNKTTINLYSDNNPIYLSHNKKISVIKPGQYVHTAYGKYGLVNLAPKKSSTCTYEISFKVPKTYAHGVVEIFGPFPAKEYKKIKSDTKSCFGVKFSDGKKSQFKKIGVSKHCIQFK